MLARLVWSSVEPNFPLKDQASSSKSPQITRMRTKMFRNDPRWVRCSKLKTLRCASEVNSKCLIFWTTKRLLRAIKLYLQCWKSTRKLRFTLMIQGLSTINRANLSKMDNCSFHHMLAARLSLAQRRILLILRSHQSLTLRIHKRRAWTWWVRMRQTRRALTKIILIRRLRRRKSKRNKFRVFKWSRNVIHRCTRAWRRSQLSSAAIVGN